jgi:hypothetical protein
MAKAGPPPTAPSSASHPRSRTSAESFALCGRSDPPEPEFNAYRKDLADVALAGRVIASHYAEAVERAITTATDLREAPSTEAEVIRPMSAGERFLLLDDSLGWAWGYAGAEGRVGYVRSDAVSPAD